MNSFETIIQAKCDVKKYVYFAVVKEWIIKKKEFLILITRRDKTS